MSIQKVIFCTPIMAAVAMAASAQNYSTPHAVGISPAYSTTAAPDANAPDFGQKPAPAVDPPTMSPVIAVEGANRISDPITVPDYTSGPPAGSYCAASEIDWRTCTYLSRTSQ